MPKPPTSVRSIRLPDSMWAELGEMAGEVTTVNALVQAAVGHLLARPAPGSVRETIAKARASASIDPPPVTFGPQRAGYGQRLKGAKK